MKQGLDWYKRDPRAFLDGVQGMGPELIGCYAVLLDLIYARGGDTLRDDRHLAGVLGCSVRMARTLTDQLIKAKKITQTGDTITNKRAEKDAKQRRNERETLANHGRMGGERSGEYRKNNNLPEAIREEKSREDTPPIAPPLEESTDGRTIRSGNAADTAAPGKPGSVPEADENAMDAGTGEDKPKADDPPAPKPKPKRTATAKCGLDGNWEPDQGAIAYAETRGLDWERTWEDFRDYHIAHGSKWAGDKGWNSSWQRWCRNAAERAAKAASRQNQQSRAGVAGQGDRENDPWHEAILARRAAGVGQFGEAIPKAGDGQPDGEGCEVLPFGDWFRDDGTG
jgi:uncharacterized protein YdaU (DUF1376 family)